MNEGRAIRAFARMRFLAMAEVLEADLRGRRPSDVYGDDIGAKSIWDEYCYETRNGQTFELADAWSSLLDPLVADLIERTSHEEAVLLTIAEQWRMDAPEFDDDEYEPSSNSEMIAQAVRDRLFELATNSDWHDRDPFGEGSEDWDEEEPDCGLPLTQSDRWPFLAMVRRLWSAFRGGY